MRNGRKGIIRRKGKKDAASLSLLGDGLRLARVAAVRGLYLHRPEPDSAQWLLPPQVHAFQPQLTLVPARRGHGLGPLRRRHKYDTIRSGRRRSASAEAGACLSLVAKLKCGSAATAE